MAHQLYRQALRVETEWLIIQIQINNKGRRKLGTVNGVFLPCLQTILNEVLISSDVEGRNGNEWNGSSIILSGVEGRNGKERNRSSSESVIS